jgi:phospholipid/cholesterol/gamma-HCH transport system permease protein
MLPVLTVLGLVVGIVGGAGIAFFLYEMPVETVS